MHFKMFCLSLIIGSNCCTPPRPDPPYPGGDFSQNRITSFLGPREALYGKWNWLVKYFSSCVVNRHTDRHTKWLLNVVRVGQNEIISKHVGFSVCLSCPKFGHGKCMKCFYLIKSLGGQHMACKSWNPKQILLGCFNRERDSHFPTLFI